MKIRTEKVRIFLADRRPFSFEIAFYTHQSLSYINYKNLTLSPISPRNCTLVPLIQRFKLLLMTSYKRDTNVMQSNKQAVQCSSVLVMETGPVL